MRPRLRAPLPLHPPYRRALLLDACGPRRSRPGRLPPSAPLASATAAQAASQAACGSTAGFAPSRGVPLLDTLMGQSLPVAAARSAVLLAACAGVVVLGKRALAEVDKRMCTVLDRTERASGVQLLAGTALVAAHRPAAALLPVYGTSYSLTVLSALLEVVVARLGLGCYPKLHFCGRHLVRLLKAVNQGLQSASQLVLLLAASWFLVAWKNRLVARAVDRLRNDADPENDNWARLLLPLSRLLTWVTVGGTSVAALGAVGLDIRPLLALGSVGSLAVGFAAQATLSNLVSAMSLYTSRPFVVGDRVQLKSLGGSTVIEGVVEEILPMRTVVRTDERVPVSINNKDVSTFMILNESQLRHVPVLTALASLDAQVTVRYQDIGSVPRLEAAVTDFLASHPDIDHALGQACTMAGFADAGISLQIKAHLTRAACARAGAARSSILLGVERVIRSAGARLAIAGADSLNEAGQEAAVEGSTGSGQGHGAARA